MEFFMFVGVTVSAFKNFYEYMYVGLVSVYMYLNISRGIINVNILRYKVLVVVFGN